jgi:hypothetical protein
MANDRIHVQMSCLAIAALTAIGASTIATSSFAETHCRGNWSAQGELLPRGSSIPYSFFAPDKRSAIKIDEEGVYLIAGSKVQEIPNTILNRYVTEVVWSTDSRQFAVNASDGGVVGTWWFFSSSSLPKTGDSSALTELLRSKLPHAKCEPAEIYNVAAIGWLNGGRELLAVAESPPHSSCQDMGKLTGVVVSLPALRIKEVLTEDTLRKRYGAMLGCRLSRLP